MQVSAAAGHGISPVNTWMVSDGLFPSLSGPLMGEGVSHVACQIKKKKH